MKQRTKLNPETKLKIAILVFVLNILIGSWAIWQAYETYFFAKAARLELAK